MKDLIGKLDYLTYEITNRYAPKPGYGGDPENDMAPANQHDLGVVLGLLGMLADITREAIVTLDEAASATARRQSAVLNGMDADV